MARNLGFPANNHALRDFDASITSAWSTTTPSWRPRILNRSSTRLEADRERGAASPKMLLSSWFLDLEIETAKRKRAAVTDGPWVYASVA